MRSDPVDVVFGHSRHVVIDDEPYLAAYVSGDKFMWLTHVVRLQGCRVSGLRNVMAACQNSGYHDARPSIETEHARAKTETDIHESNGKMTVNSTRCMLGYGSRCVGVIS